MTKDSGVDERILNQYDDYYDDGPSEWRRLGAVDKAANIVALCGALPHESVLEIGAGDGSIVSRLSELNFGKRLYALDISSSGVEVINRREIPRLLECLRFDGTHVPYEAGAFDIAVLSHVVEHLEHPRQLIFEAARVARYVFIEVPLEDMSRHAKDYHEDKVGHINFYSKRTIRWLIQSCGLRIIAQATTNPSKATYVHAAGRKGLLHYYVKQTLLTCVPGVARSHFCYHEALLATREGS